MVTPQSLRCFPAQLHEYLRHVSFQTSNSLTSPQCPNKYGTPNFKKPLPTHHTSRHRVATNASVEHRTSSAARAATTHTHRRLRSHVPSHATFPLLTQSRAQLNSLSILVHVNSICYRKFLPTTIFPNRWRCAWISIRIRHRYKSKRNANERKVYDDENGGFYRMPLMGELPFMEILGKSCPQVTRVKMLGKRMKLKLPK